MIIGRFDEVFVTDGGARETHELTFAATASLVAACVSRWGLREKRRRKAALRARIMASLIRTTGLTADADDWPAG